MVMGLDRRLVAVTDLGGTALIAAQGAAIAISAQLDLLGVAVVAFASAVGGGIIRDILLGQTPPAAFCRMRYPVAVLIAAGCVIAVGGDPNLPTSVPLRLVGALGLALFTVAGTEKALDCGCRSFTAVMIGVIGATGGGVIRDLLLAHVPTILRSDFYATAVLAGALVIILFRRAGASREISGLAGGLVCLGLRTAAILLGWHLPIING